MKLNYSNAKGFKKRISFVSIILLSVCITSVYSQNKVGDPGVTFDPSKYDSRYPQMKKWETAGVRGGIPFMNDLRIVKTLNNGDNSIAINKAINDASKESGLVAVLLKNGSYTINQQISMKSNVCLIGETRNGVKCVIKMNRGSAFYFNQVRKSGIYNLTIQGSWGKPKYPWNYSLNANDELPNNDNISVKFRKSSDCWLDKVNIYDSAKDPVRVPSNHITLRDLKVDGAHKKAGGAQGYFFIQGAYNLITGCEITHLRHISLQGGNVEYNVVYDNDFRQEVSFHSGDNGNNLIENNRITLPKDMPNSKADTPNAPYNNNQEPNYYAIMGPWSTQHQNSNHPNFVFKNQCKEENHNGTTPWSNPSILYKGPRKVKPANPATNFPALPTSQTPSGGTLYPVMIEDSNPQNEIPIVSFINPNQDAQFDPGTSLKPIVNAIDTDGTISNVKLYLNNELIREEKYAPYEWGHISDRDSQLKNLQEGTYTLKAIATDNEGGVQEAIINIKIGSNSTAPIGQLIWLKSIINNRYVVAEQKLPNAPLEADRKALGSWEKFTVIDAGNDLIALQSLPNKKYISADKIIANTYPLVADKSIINSAEKFEWIDLGDNRVALKANINGKYVQSRQNQNDSPLYARGNVIAGWETFTWGITSKKENDPSTNESIQIYPNPAKDYISVVGLTTGDYISIYDLKGKLIRTVIAKETDEQLEVSELSKGMYIVSIFGGAKLRFLKK
ncbi:T9SS C-terminal target domain-containing protein [Aquimarina sp. BL5]|uniref:T9SS type A sorting domain-containing protein n=1 Tax=Aquimarina sp. BL5 TaxID=1714860 RepID=UPI000E4677BF|nr:T9SS type A sorting domain-containing protein [Aquimarina sp. BL5]AXT51699.1 T9SS C-terminal target domain-containing protein [Aquimarina sp. BL5]RKN08791.1 T9SS C-terminal target domain-containing protein [Aquimarina sp. BL5]